MSVEPYDEHRIDAGDVIIRRVNPHQHVIWDDNLGKRRISSKLLSPSSQKNGGMSVDIEALIVADGRVPQDYVTTPVFIGSIAFTAGAARALELQIGYDPLRDNPYHGEVWGISRPNRFSKRQKNGLIAASSWYVEIENVDIR